jgi:hypothetical protein
MISRCRFCGADDFICGIGWESVGKLPRMCLFDFTFEAKAVSIQ